VRGNGTTDQELAKTQSWIEFADPVLFGKNGDIGLIREHQEDRASRKQREADTDSYNRRVVTTVAILGTAVPLLIKVLELTHVIPK
jgi:hypothetical protein